MLEGYENVRAFCYNCMSLFYPCFGIYGRPFCERIWTLALRRRFLDPATMTNYSIQSQVNITTDGV